MMVGKGGWLWAGFCVGLLTAGVVKNVFAAAEDAPARMTVAQLREARRAAAWRQRRIIFNNDGNEPVYFCKQATAEALLACRTTPLVGSQVDSIFYCTWSSGFGCFTHNTQVGEVFTCTEEGFRENKTAQLISQGTDPLKIMVDFCRQQGIEIFWSMRMNDVHDAWGAWYSPYLFPRLKREHPEYLVGSRKRRPPFGGWTAVDYSHAEIRRLAAAYVEEVCRNYDVDGVELDFFRHPVLFKRHAWGQATTQHERDLMTDLLRRLREMTEEVGRRRGRPILMAVRVPDSVECCRVMGLDIIRWLREGLVDLMVVSGYFRFNPWETSVRLGHRYGVPVYPCLSEPRISDAQGLAIRRSVDCYRARAMNVWEAGADGVYLFNFFDPNSPLWRELGDPHTLATLDKLYCVNVRSTRSLGRWIPDGRKFRTLPVLNPDEPKKIGPRQTETIWLRVGESPPPSTHPKFTLRLRAEGQPVQVAFNGRRLSNPTSNDPWTEYAVPADVVQKGINRITLSASSEPAGLIVRDVALQVAYAGPDG